MSTSTVYTSGAPLVRMSSFDRLMSTLNDAGSEDVDSAAEQVQSWYRRKRKMQTLLGNFTNTGALKEFVPLVVSLIQAVPHMDSLDEAQGALSEAYFRNALNAILCAYPRDPGLKTRNKQCRSAQFVSLAIAIHSFGDDILVTDDSGSQDTCFEAKQCRNAASLLTLSFLHLLEGTATANITVKEFRALLLMYRFCVRYFLFAMDAWKKVDGERLARDMEEPYSIAYRAVLWATNVVGQDESAGPDNEIMLKQAQAQLDKMRFVLEKTMGKAAAKDKMEELEATQNMLMAEALSMEMEPAQSIEADSSPQSPSKAA